MLVQPAAMPTLDASFQTPTDIAWDEQPSGASMDVITWNYYTLPSSPASVSSDDSPAYGIKSMNAPLTPESRSDSEQPSSLPTHQVLDTPDAVDAPCSPSSASPPPSRPRQSSISTDNEALLKRSFTTISGVRRGRGNGERITTKDFVPPDVTGLSKREARLLKNRAAAFLSRQRKREEFEAMEIRVKELEEETSRLQPLAEKGRRYDQLLSEMEELRLRLSAAEQREQELTAELANKSPTNLPMKTDLNELALPPSPYSANASPCQNSTIDFMKQCLLSVLPSLFSLPPQTPLPVTVSSPGRSTAEPLITPFSHQSVSLGAKTRNAHVGVEFWSSSIIEDSPEKIALSCEPPTSLGTLSISLDVVPTEDGRGCVRAHISDIVRPSIHGYQATPSLGSWSGSDTTVALPQFAPLSLSAPFTIPSTGSLDHLSLFIGGNNSHHESMGFDPSILPPGYPPIARQSPEQVFDYYPELEFQV